MGDQVVLIGHVGVDAGMIMIGDPCYGEHEKNHPANRDWLEFCRWYEKVSGDGQYPRFAEIPYDLGHPGLGVVCDSGFGDGTYPVYATIRDCGTWGRRIIKIEVDLDPNWEMDDE